MSHHPQRPDPLHRIIQGIVYNKGNLPLHLTFADGPEVEVKPKSYSELVTGKLDEMRHNNLRYQYQRYHCGEGDATYIRPDSIWYVSFSGPGSTEASLESHRLTLEYKVSA